jgi:hypothetical protein
MRRPSHPSHNAASCETRARSCAQRQQRRPLDRQLAERMVKNAFDRLAIGQRELHHEIRARQNASSTASMKFVVVTNSTDGRFFAILVDAEQHGVGRPMHVDRVGFERRRGTATAKLSTSSIKTMTNGRRLAISGIVSVNSRVTLR